MQLLHAAATEVRAQTATTRTPHVDCGWRAAGHHDMHDAVDAAHCGMHRVSQHAMWPSGVTQLSLRCMLPILTTVQTVKSSMLWCAIVAQQRRCCKACRTDKNVEHRSTGNMMMMMVEHRSTEQQHQVVMGSPQLALHSRRVPRCNKWHQQGAATATESSAPVLEAPTHHNPCSTLSFKHQPKGSNMCSCSHGREVSGSMLVDAGPAPCLLCCSTPVLTNN